AAARLIAPYDQVRMTTTFRIDADDYVERLSLLRSGPFARTRLRLCDDERATLAHPDHSLRAFRNLLPEIEPWTITDDARATPLQAYRQALGTIERASGNNHFVATHGGAILLALPEISKRDDSWRDFEVVKLHATLVDGHRLVTLRLRTAPEVK